MPCYERWGDEKLQPCPRGKTSYFIQPYRVGVLRGICGSVYGSPQSDRFLGSQLTVREAGCGSSARKHSSFHFPITQRRIARLRSQAHARDCGLADLMQAIAPTRCRPRLCSCKDPPKGTTCGPNPPLVYASSGMLTHNRLQTTRS